MEAIVHHPTGKQLNRFRPGKGGRDPKILTREAEKAEEFLPVSGGSVSGDGDVPGWIRDLVSKSDVKPVSLDRMRNILSKCKKPLSQEIIDERYGDEVE